MKSFFKTLMMLVALLVTAGLGYYLYVNRSLQDSSNNGIATDVSAEAAVFLHRLNELKEIELNSDILSDERFSSLNTFSAPVVAEEIGRTNPFEVN